MQELQTTIEEQLKSEARVCPRCRLEVSNPFIELCPRCYDKLPKLHLECTGCVHRIMCPVAPRH